MEQLNVKFDDILTKKMQYVMDSVADCSSKKESKKLITLPNNTSKPTNANTNTTINKADVVDYTAKQTLSKIAAEQDRKYKSSKAYKNALDYKAN